RTNSLQQAPATIHADSLTTKSTTDIYDDETGDFAPGLLFFALISLAFIAACIGAGIVVCIAAILIVAGMISLGILSASVMVGLYKRSLATGVKAFIVLCSLVGGTIMGGTIFWLVNNARHWFSNQTAVMLGAATGMITGLACGLAVFYVL